MQLQTINVALKFLERVQLTGTEAPALMAVVNELHAEAQALQAPPQKAPENEPAKDA